MRPRRVPILALSCALILAPAFGWGPEGHRIVAHIAAQRLNAKARAAVAAILPAGESLESVASWADEVRRERRATGAWHYIDIPTSAAPGSDWSQYCPEAGCVLRAIPQMEKTLTDPASTPTQKDEALRYLVHFIGDMHQPLHVGERGDQGGNKVQVTFEGHPLNLHSAWDSRLLLAWFKQDPAAESALLKGAPEAERAALTAGTVDDWAWQSQTIAAHNVYAPLDACHCTVLDEAYLQQAIPVLRLQLLRAGERLGRVLNDLLGG